MVQLSNWKYDQSITENYILALEYKDSLEKISKILIKEYKELREFSKTPFDCETALNIDKVEKYEAVKHNRNTEASVDMAFAVKNNKEIKFVLCELKLNSRNVNNIKHFNIFNKYIHSKNYFSCKHSIYKHIYVILNDKVGLERARNLLARRNKNIPIKTCNIDSLHKEFFV